MHNVAKVKQSDGEKWCSQSKLQRIHGQWHLGQLECNLNYLW
jgi:hypothetical protein